jgi:hypothetical protein
MEAAKPVARSPLVVHNRDDHDLVPLYEVDDRVRKALEYVPADVGSAGPDWPRFGHLANPEHAIVDHPGEVPGTFVGSLAVPDRSSLVFSQGPGMKAVWFSRPSGIDRGTNLGDCLVAIDEFDAAITDLTDAVIEFGRPRRLPLISDNFFAVVRLEAAQQARDQLATLVVGELERLFENGLECSHENSVARFVARGRASACS